jgi:hypothetical protein
MSSAGLLPRPRGNYLRLSAVDWKMYTRLLLVFAERAGVRLAYDRGELEIIGPRETLDNERCILANLVFVLTEELGLPLMSGGSTTLRRRRLRRGIEADACFWIGNAHRMQGVRRLNLQRDPPPDLAIDVPVVRSSLNRLAIYSALGVPEVWRLVGDVLTFHVLDNAGHHVVATASRSFSCVTPADLLVFLQRARKAGDENPVFRDFRAWVRQRLAQQP